MRTTIMAEEGRGAPIAHPGLPHTEMISCYALPRALLPGSRITSRKPHYFPAAASSRSCGTTVLGSWAHVVFSSPFTVMVGVAW